MTSVIKKQTRVALAALCAASTLLGGVAVAAPQDEVETEFFGSEPWPAQRIVLLLPLQLGQGWNLDRAKAAPLLPEAEAKLQTALQRTGKFSTTQLHRYNPILLRGVQERLLTKEQADALVANPTLDAVQKALAPMRFEQAPLIAQVTLDEVAVAPGTPTATVTTTATGRLYELDSAEPVREVVVTSRPLPLYRIERRKGQTILLRQNPRQRLMLAADNAFNQLARDFVRPIEEITLPDPVIVTESGPITLGPSTVIEVPKGQVLGTFEVPQK